MDSVSLELRGAKCTVKGYRGIHEGTVVNCLCRPRPSSHGEGLTDTMAGKQSRSRETWKMESAERYIYIFLTFMLFDRTEIH